MIVKSCWCTKLSTVLVSYVLICFTGLYCEAFSLLSQSLSNWSLCLRTCCYLTWHIHMISPTNSHHQRPNGNILTSSNVILKNEISGCQLFNKVPTVLFFVILYYSWNITLFIELISLNNLPCGLLRSKQRDPNVLGYCFISCPEFQVKITYLQSPMCSRSTSFKLNTLRKPQYSCISLQRALICLCFSFTYDLLQNTLNVKWLWKVTTSHYHYKFSYCLNTTGDCAFWNNRGFKVLSIESRQAECKTKIMHTIIQAHCYLLRI